MAEVFLLQQKQKIKIAYSQQENSAVKIAINNLKQDICKVCSCDVEIQILEDKTALTGKTIVVSTLDIYEDMLKEVLGEYKPDVALLYDDFHEKHWEGFLHHMQGDILFIVGADRRGTIYGIYDLCELIGVSPWYYWADVPVKKKEYFALSENYRKIDWPEVPYRGIFLNDEEELEAWSKLHTKDETIGPETYEHIFELILRLKGNYIWPAMHVNYFNGNSLNGKLAETMGVVVGTSHCDMLLRSNQNEWKPWLREKGYPNIKYDYSLEGDNREKIKEYWTESVELNRDYEVSYTVGMRGIHDSGFITETIDSDTSLTPEQRTRKKVELLEQVIADQREILKQTLGEKRSREAMQTFIPYKEVLDLYDQNLKVPEDITLIWVDDNFGYVRRYPNEKERARSGGNGLYYHSSYWAFPGMSYLFINSIPLAHTGNELKKCWESGIRKSWVLNVGALKPLEQDVEFFLRYAWEAGKNTGETKDVTVFTQRWIDRNFTGNIGNEVALLYNRFAQITNVCKLEHMQSGKFSQTAYGDEGLKRLMQLKDIFDKGNKLYEQLPEEEKDAFYQLVLMKIHASWYINAAFYCADRSILSYNRGAMNAADYYLAVSREMDERKRRMLFYYNHEISDGKWEGILTPESFSPPPTALYPMGRPALVIGEAKLGVADAGQKITFEFYGESRKWIDLFNYGAGEVAFVISGPKWLEISQSKGSVCTEQRISLRVREEYREWLFTEDRQDILFIQGERGVHYELVLSVRKQPDYQETMEKGCFVEADGYVSISAGEYIAKKDTDAGYWRCISHMGRGGGNVVEAFLEKATGAELTTIEAPSIEYSFFLQSAGCPLLEIHRFLTLNSTGQIRLLVAVDAESPILVETETVDEWRGAWKQAVMNNGEKLYVTLPFVTEGVHRLRIYALDRYISLSKLVIYTSEKKKSNLGPDISFCYGKENTDCCCGESEETDVCYTDAFWVESTEEQGIYRSVSKELPLLPMLYGDKLFCKTHFLYERSDERKQTQLGAPKYIIELGQPKNVFYQFGKGIFVEENGVLAIEAEYALENSKNAYLTTALTDKQMVWTHIQAETNGRTGMAMTIEGRELFWNTPEKAPGMHFKLEVSEAGKYNVWLLVRFEDNLSDACYLTMNGKLLEYSDRCYSNDLFSYCMKQRWCWRFITDVDLTSDVHTLSIYGRKSGLQIDRIYITKGEEWPPIDVEWQESTRKELNEDFFSELHV